MSVLLCSWLDCNRNTYMDQKLQPPLSFNLSSLCIIIWTSLVTQMVKHLPRMRKTQVQSLGWEDLLEKEMATHSSTLVWKMPWTEEPGRLQSMGSQSQTWLSDFTFTLRICCTAQRIEPIFYNNYTWSMTFKSCESLYCIPETSIIL